MSMPSAPSRRFRFVAVVATVIAMTIAGLVVASPANADTTTPLKNLGNDQCFQPADGSLEVGAAIVQHRCLYDDVGRGVTSQEWFYKCVNSGCTVVHVVNRATQLCLRARGLDGPANGEEIMQWTCNGISDLNWTPHFGVAIGNPSRHLVTFESRLFGSTGFCLDVPDSSPVEDTALQLYECNGTAAQVWYVDTIIG